MTHQRQPRCGVLLAGGTGSRFGGVPKGLLPLGSARVADGAMAALVAVCDDVVIAANDAAAASWFPGHRVVRDRVPQLGALGALQTAFDAAAGRTVVVCAWDMPFVTAGVLGELVAVVEAGAPCCVPVHADATMEVLCAAYATACGPIAQQLIDRGERAAHALVREAAGATWEIEHWMSPAESRRTFHNVNTADDLRVAEHWLTIPAEAAR